MCGPEVPWDWLMLDISFVMVLVGGGLTLRSRVANPFTWMLFAMLSVCVGGFLLAETWQANVAFAAAAQATTAMQVMQGC